MPDKCATKVPSYGMYRHLMGWLLCQRSIAMGCTRGKRSPLMGCHALTTSKNELIAWVCRACGVPRSHTW